MAVRVFDAASVTLTTSYTDVSTRVESCVFRVSNQSVATRTMGNTWGTSLPTNQKTWSVQLALQQDFTSSDVPVFSILNTALSSQGSLFISAHPTTAAQGATNPGFSGTVSLDGEWDILNTNANPTDPVISLTLRGNGALTIATSSTS